MNEFFFTVVPIAVVLKDINQVILLNEIMNVICNNPVYLVSYVDTTVSN